MHTLRIALATAVTSLLATISPLSFAIDEVSGVTLNPGVGISHYDDERSLNNGPHGSLGIGYRFDNPWGVEFNYARINTDTDPAKIDVDVDQWRIDGLYQLPVSGDLRPFASFGLGKANFDSAGISRSDKQLNLGLGMKYLLSANSALRADMKVFRAFDDKEVDSSFTLGYQYTFGSAKRAAPVATIASVLMDPDSDNDGVFDALDQCPATPSGVVVDSTGCAADSDRDGVIDALDACSDTPPPGLVDSSGCYRTLEKEVRVVIDVEFDYNSANSRPEHKEQLQQVADFMQQYPTTRVTFEGHTDSRGSDSYNLRLSEQRAATIAKLLTEAFNIDSARISAIGFGESKPIADNDSDVGRQKNRRVVAEIKAMSQEVLRRN